MAVLDRRLQNLQAHLDETPSVEVTFFVPDERKSGGACRTVRGMVSGIDTQRRVLKLDNDRCIPLDDIVSITGSCING